MPKRTRLLLFLFAACLLSSSLAAQQQPAAASQPNVPLYKVQTRAVTLDVIVTGKNGAPLAGLTKDDFTLLEDNAPQAIASFQAVDMQSDTKKNMSGPAPRTIIVFDEVLTNFYDLASARQALHAFFNRNNGQLEQPTMLYALTASGLVALHGYTQDGHALGNALHQHRTYLSPCELGRCWFLLPSSSPDIAVSPVQALQQIAMSEEATQTHKTIVWLTSGVPYFIPPNLLPADYQESIFDDARHTSDLFRRARITLYTVDTHGLPHIHLWSNLNLAAFAAPAKDSSGSTLSDLSPQTLAMQTGGQALFGRNDTKNEIAESVAQGDVYYSLLYYPSNTNFDGKFRAITVKIDKPGYDVHTRDGYYALPDPALLSALDIQHQLAQVERSPIAYSGVPIVLTRVKLTGPPDVANISIYVDISSVLWQTMPDGTRQSTIDVAAVDFATPDKPLHAVSNQVTVNIPQQNDTKSEHLFKVPVKLLVTLPHGYVRVVVRDSATGQMGSANITSLKKLPVYPHVAPALETR